MQRKNDITDISLPMNTILKGVIEGNKRAINVG